MNMEQKSDLQNILAIQPDVILQDQFLINLLLEHSDRVNFDEFFTDIFNYPNIFHMLSTKQDIWEKYMKDKFPTFYSTLVQQTYLRKNWFYEIIMLSLSDIHPKYYYNTEMSDILTNLIPKFRTYNKFKNSKEVYLDMKDLNDLDYEKMRRLAVSRNLSKLFTTNYELKINYLFQDLFYWPSQISNPQIYEKETIISNINGYTSLILFSNNDLIKVNYNDIKNVDETHLVRRNIIKIIEVTPYRYMLQNDGTLYRLTSNEPSFFKVTLPFEVKDIQREGETSYSFVDSDDNIYLYFKNSISFDLTPYDFTLANPLLRNTKVISYAIKIYIVAIPNDIQVDSEMRDQGFYTSLYYVDVHGRLFCVILKNYQIFKSVEMINTYRNVQVKNVWIETIQAVGDLQDYISVIMYSDIHGNIYEYVESKKLSVKYQLPNKEPIKQLLMRGYSYEKLYGIILIFVTYNGKIYWYMNDKSESEKYTNNILNIIDREYAANNINIQNINDDTEENVRFDLQNNVNAVMKQFPKGIKIVNSGDYFGVLFEVINIVDYVVYPYSLYLLNLLEKNVISDSVKNNQIIFKLKNVNYVFRTSIPQI